MHHLIYSTRSALIKSAAVLAGGLGLLAPFSVQADPILPHPITDINKDLANSDPAEIHQVDNKLYFLATDKKGRGLYVQTLKRNSVNKPAVEGKSQLLTRFKAGVEPEQFVVTGMSDVDLRYAKIYFHTPGYGLYAGPKKVKKVDLDPNNSNDQWLADLTTFKNETRYDTRYRAARLFFSGQDKKAGNTLFISNGTAKGTKVFSSRISTPYGMADCNGTLFFAALDETTPSYYDLWRTDGTAAATAQITTDPNLQPYGMTASNIGGCFFGGSADGSSFELYHSDGTLGGTTALTSSHNAPYAFTPFGGGMLYSGYSAAHGYELWYADNGQAYELNDINPSSSAGSNPSYLVNAGDEQVYLSAYDGNSYKLYRSNGTPSSLTEIRDAQNNSMVNVSAIVPIITNFNDNGDRVYFTVGASNALWYVDNSDGDAIAYPVLTGQGHQVLNATQLSKFVDNGIYRLYFTTDGAGTEFANLGTEMWVVGTDL